MRKTFILIPPIFALIVFLTPRAYGQEIEKPKSVLEGGHEWKLNFRNDHEDSLSVPESTFENVKLIVITGASFQGGDGWRIKHNLGIGCEKELLSGLSLIGFLDYARFDYHASYTLHPPYQSDPSHTLSIVTMLKAHVPWYVSPFVQVGLGISYVNRGKLFYHDPTRYPPTPEADHVNGGGSVLSYLVNLMVGAEFYPIKELSLFLEGGFNGDWQKDRYPANSLARFGIGVEM